MGKKIFKKAFGGKKSFSSVLTDSQNRIFYLCNVHHPTDAQKMKVSFYLCVFGMAMLNDLGGEYLCDAIDKLVEETKELTKPLRMRVGELANNAEQLEMIMSYFPSEWKITESTTVNGLAAFEAMYFSMGQGLMTHMISHNRGPRGEPGYTALDAAILVADGIFGEGKSRENSC